MSRTALLLSTCAGLEDVTLRELQALVPAVAGLEVRAGQVHAWVDAPPEQAVAAAMSMRTVHHVQRVITEWALPEADPLVFIRRAISALPIPGLDTAESFAVRCRRVGTHPFRSMDAEREAGAGVWDQRRVPANLDAPDLDVRLDVHDTRCLVMIRHTRRPLGRRYDRAVFRRSAAQPAIAAAMVQLLAQALGRAPDVVLDPFCGGGTLVLEAAHAWPGATLLASDILPELADGTRDNVAASSDRVVETRAGDAATLAALWGDRAPVDAVLANPPFGKQLARGVDLHGLYGAVFAGLERILRPGGVAVMLVWKRRTFVGAMGRGPSLERVHARVVEAGGLWIGIEVVRKRDGAREHGAREHGARKQSAPPGEPAAR
jgi:tRNA (guanine6-N2)-methyltransferase